MSIEWFTIMGRDYYDHAFDAPVWTLTDDLTTPEKPAPPDLKDDGADDEALPDVSNDPIPEPAQPEPEGT